MTQVDRITEYLKKYKTITPLDAYLDLGIMRLSARIQELKAKGVQIESKMITCLNRRGEKVSVKEYRLEQ